ncbi:MAG: hypothetical protein DRJ40_03280 [Thermoprotei archaeon]|nr:MAG: hypothetical protein DRJ40_03280 [Thermoprotei archaeon]
MSREKLPHIALLSKVAVDLFWCPNCNVPLISIDKCSRCGERGFPVKATPPRDVRPAFEFDVQQLRGLASTELGIPGKYVDKLIPSNQIILLNKVPYPDVADEVIVGGKVVAHRFFDPVLWRWRLKPVYHGVAAMVREKVGYYAIVNLPKLTRGYEVHRDKIVECELPPYRGSFVAVETSDGRYQAVAIKTRGQRIKIVKVWPSKDYSSPGKCSSIDVAIEANYSRLRRLESRSCIFLQTLKDKMWGDRHFFISFSGGKDSLVALHLAVKVLDLRDVVFNDTGLELPETLSNVDEVAKAYGLRVYRTEIGDKFWNLVSRYGPPARDYRWCCEVCKLAPLVDLIKRVFPGKRLSIIGQRKLESFKRASRSRLSRSSVIPKTLVAAPIHDWCALDVWLYIFREKLNVNKVYFHGIDRVGCWMCPACELGEYEILKELHPELWSRWEEVLCRFATSRGYPEEWVKYGLWRWRSYPGDIRRVLQLCDFDVSRASEVDVVRAMVESPRVMHSGEVLRIELARSSNVSSELVYELLYTFKDLEILYRGDKVVVRYGNYSACIEVSSCYLIEIRGVRDWSSDLEILLKYLLYPNLVPQLCTGCSLCVNLCETGARTVDTLHRVVLERCSRCGSCSRVCPVFRYVTSDLVRFVKLKVLGIV